jgi:hypothetical protein
MKKKLDNWLIGIALGFLGPILVLFLINLYQFPSLEFGVFLKTALYHGQLSSWLKIAVLFNLASFFLTLNNNLIKSARGVIAATFIYAGLIVYLMYAFK